MMHFSRLNLHSADFKAFDGGYSDWSACSECSVTCGGGTQTFIRTCVPLNGVVCSEPNEKTEPCNEQDCPVDGGYTDWSISECSVTCGGGIQTLTRTCTNPPPSNGGKDCSGLGLTEKTISCNEQECPVDGGYSDWSECTKCSVTCGGGTQILTRTCTNPPPANGGKNCDGAAQKTAPCNEINCPPTCTAGLDIGIILDKSASVKIKNLKKAIQFLKELVVAFNPSPDADHFGLITFNKKANLVFDFTQYQTENALLQKLDEEPIKLQLKTRTDLALKTARDELFTESGGDRPDKPNIMIVLTDGRPTHPQKRKFDFKAFAEKIAKDFKEKGVYTEAVGIGKNIKEETLQQIAGANNPVFIVDDFDELKESISDIKSKACSD